MYLFSQEVVVRRGEIGTPIKRQLSNFTGLWFTTTMETMEEEEVSPGHGSREGGLRQRFHCSIHSLQSSWPSVSVAAAGGGDVG